MTAAPLGKAARELMARALAPAASMKKLRSFAVPPATHVTLQAADTV
jgi:hypothetical protein